MKLDKIVDRSKWTIDLDAVALQGDWVVTQATNRCFAVNGDQPSTGSVSTALRITGVIAERVLEVLRDTQGDENTVQVGRRLSPADMRQVMLLVADNADRVTIAHDKFALDFRVIELRSVHTGAD